MRTIDGPVPYREVTGRYGRVHRLGETDADIMGRTRIWMIVLPFAGTAGVALAGAAFAVAGGARAWSGGPVPWPLGVWVFCQGVVALPVGRLRDGGRLPARVAVPFGAAATAVAGLLLLHAPEATAARLGFAVFGGAGAGAVWVTCAATAGKWFPDRRGGATTLVSGGFACGTVPVAFVAAGHPSAFVAAGHPGAGGRPSLAVVLGLALCLVAAGAGRFLADPPRNWWPDRVAPPRPRVGAAVRGTEADPPAVRQYGPREAAGTPALWLMWCCLLCAGGVGVLCAAVRAPSAREPWATGGNGTAVLCAALCLDVVGVGALGLLSDRWGRRATLTGVCVVLGTAPFGALESGRLGGPPFLLLCVLLSGLAGAAVPALLASLTADCFGENDNAAHLGLVHSATAVAGPAAAVLGAGVVGARDPHVAYVLAGSLGLASSVLALFLTAPGRIRVRRIVPNPQPLGEEMA
ncbi:MFS transporter [Streptomyces doudnae]|uniref:MFS transporter n=1 Tax=Streptomyces doudnae TaxID=3075536 RepID=A0ABD5EXN8_9ACTN|nr:MFS transporter [Streptomyces sp. DSM 41981]MDT0439531.1 MFS transporter [Streptomyces sp. DSM 41981]